jgi:hypothetical protein
MTSLILIILASICNSIMDVLFTRYDKSIFKKCNPLYWNPQLSWKYKWKMPLQPPIKKWYYFGVYPQYEERFPYSSTIFVFITDAWHLFKALMLLFIMLSIVNYVPLINPYIDWFLYYITWTSIFTYLYTKGFIENDKSNKIST